MQLRLPLHHELVAGSNPQFGHWHWQAQVSTPANSHDMSADSVLSCKNRNQLDIALYGAAHADIGISKLLHVCACVWAGCWPGQLHPVPISSAVDQGEVQVLELLYICVEAGCACVSKQLQDVHVFTSCLFMSHVVLRTVEVANRLKLSHTLQMINRSY